MKINKLLFFLLAVISLNSCVEYVNNGTKPDGPEPPEQQKYTAEQANPEDAKYIGDVFEFKALLNGVDVTASTKFRVNGTNISGKEYTPAKVGDHSVIATMDNLTANFKFKVLEEDEEPEPTGNRIEYNSVSNPLNTTLFVLNGVVDQQTGDVSIPNLTMPDGTTPALNWVMVSFDGTSYANAKHIYYLDVLVPRNGNNMVFPFQAPQIAIQEGFVEINGAAPFTITNMTMAFAATGNTLPVGNPNPQPGTANYTSEATGANSGELAKLFWNGEYLFDIQDLQAKPKGKNVKNLKINNNTSFQVKNLKITK